METILEVENLKTYFYSQEKIVPAVDGVSFTLKKGEILGIVGESGCGKSTIARSILQLIDKSYCRIADGKILFKKDDLARKNVKEMLEIRGNKISMIFQNPLTSLNPVYTVGDQISEVIIKHQNVSRKEAREKTLKMLKMVRISDPELRINDYPHQMSGGMQQRIIIAIALACRPELLIADEPTTALDVTIQAQIMDLIKELNKELGMGIMLITHDMGVVAEMCDNIIVMYGGVIVEKGSTKKVFENPSHPYTKGLLASIPSIESEDIEELYSIKGVVPRFYSPVKGCRFYNRCPAATDKCQKEIPVENKIDENHSVFCWNYEEK